MMRATAKRLERLEQQVYDLKLELREIKHMNIPDMVKGYVEVIVKEQLCGVMVKRDAEQTVGMFKAKLDGKFDDAFNNASKEIVKELSRKEEK